MSIVIAYGHAESVQRQQPFAVRLSQDNHGYYMDVFLNGKPIHVPLDTNNSATLLNAKKQGTVGDIKLTHGNATEHVLLTLE